MTSKKLTIKTIKDIPGLYYIPHVNLDLNKTVYKLDINDNWFNVNPKNPNSRKVQHFGYKYNYLSSNVNEKCDDIPKYLNRIKKKLVKICKVKNLQTDEFNQCIVNNYKPGQGIGRHIDTTNYGPVIGCFTAGSGAKMIFKRSNERFDLYIEPNSLYIMSGDARYKWTHEMYSVKSDTIDGKRIPRSRRVSFTFRNVPS